MNSEEKKYLIINLSLALLAVIVAVAGFFEVAYFEKPLLVFFITLVPACLFFVRCARLLADIKVSVP